MEFGHQNRYLDIQQTQNNMSIPSESCFFARKCRTLLTIRVSLTLFGHFMPGSMHADFLMAVKVQVNDAKRSVDSQLVQHHNTLTYRVI